WPPCPALEGIRTTAWRSPLGSIPDAAISPRLLMVSPSVTVRWERLGTNLFRSIMGPPHSGRIHVPPRGVSVAPRAIRTASRRTEVRSGALSGPVDPAIMPSQHGKEQV